TARAGDPARGGRGDRVRPSLSGGFASEGAATRGRGGYPGHRPRGSRRTLPLGLGPAPAYRARRWQRACGPDARSAPRLHGVRGARAHGADRVAERLRRGRPRAVRSSETAVVRRLAAAASAAAASRPGGPQGGTFENSALTHVWKPPAIASGPQG